VVRLDAIIDIDGPDDRRPPHATAVGTAVACGS
jgi:hypothetical protein